MIKSSISCGKDSSVDSGRSYMCDDPNSCSGRDILPSSMFLGWREGNESGSTAKGITMSRSGGIRTIATVRSRPAKNAQRQCLRSAPVEVSDTPDFLPTNQRDTLIKQLAYQLFGSLSPATTRKCV